MPTADEAWVDALHPISRSTFFSNLVTGKTQQSQPLSFVKADETKFLSARERELRLLLNAFYTNLPAMPRRKDIALQLAKLSCESLDTSVFDFSGAGFGALGAQCIAWALLEQRSENDDGDNEGNDSSEGKLSAAITGSSDWLQRLSNLGMVGRSGLVVGQMNLSNNKIFARELADVNRLRLLFFALRQHRSLSFVNLSYNALGPLGGALCCSLLSDNATLHSLSLRGCGLGDDGVAELARGLMSCLGHNGGVGSGLVHLDVAENKVRDAGMIALSRALAVNQCLLGLNLSGNMFGPVGLRALGTALRLNVTLDSLWLDGNDLTGALRLPNMRDYSGIQALFHCNAARNLKTISMERTALGNDGVHRIAPLLYGKVSLALLNLRACSLGRKGLEGLLEVLRQNAGIEIVQVGQNEGVEGVSGAMDNRLVF